MKKSFSSIYPELSPPFQGLRACFSTIRKTSSDELRADAHLLRCVTTLVTNVIAIKTSIALCMVKCAISHGKNLI